MRKWLPARLGGGLGRTRIDRPKKQPHRRGDDRRRYEEDRRRHDDDRRRDYDRKRDRDDRHRDYDRHYDDRRRR